jgi:type IV secretory pathway VirB9-like protein
MRVRFARTGDMGRRNYNYDKRDPEGCPLLAPLSVYDDGTRTTLLFAPHAVLPEIYVFNQDGKEAVATTVNDTTPAGLRVMVPTVQREMRLRRGGKVCALRDNAFNSVGIEAAGGNGTISPDVVRGVRAP